MSEAKVKSKFGATEAPAAGAGPLSPSSRSEGARRIPLGKREKELLVEIYKQGGKVRAVSYTHLTLPTSDLV